MGRFSQAISEGDGISIIPVLHGDVGELAALVEEAGAEAVAVWTPDEAERARSRTSLPVLVREANVAVDPDLGVAGVPSADACIVVYEAFADEEVFEEVHSALVEGGLDCVVDVRDEDELERALERVDPDIVLISRSATSDEADELERALDLLADVPAGKLVVAESGALSREQVVALERAGVDALLVHDLVGAPDFSLAVEELVGGRRAGR